ncbi:MAG TPA: DNA mismatch repair protein MutS [Firmicutes bacterium]|nr:DNA mismatch repair protein MutS [Candidatus Fermentithermobacillaceae bacterium]
MKERTPMMSQYKRLKAKYPDALLFFRLGDFYEMFYEDAETGARELGIALTGRVAGQGERAPMCGVPHHSVDDYIKILVDKGYKVAICEQLEDPSQAKGLVHRDVVRVITPGTYWEGAEASQQSYIASVWMEEAAEGKASLAACDLSTGEVLLAEFKKTRKQEIGARRKVPADEYRELWDELSKLRPKEFVLPEGASPGLRDAVNRVLPGIFVSGASAGAGHSFDVITDVYGTSLVDRLKEEGRLTALRGLAVLLGYLRETQMVSLGHLKTPVFYLEEGFLEIDPSTRRNLELTERLQGGREGSLLWVLDRTCTTMGSRLLRQWIERPLRDPGLISQRLSAVERFFTQSGLRLGVRKALGRVRDLERLMTKMSYGSMNARDLVAVAESLEAVPRLKELLEGEKDIALLANLSEALDPVPEARELVRKAIVDDPPAVITEGGIVREGYDPDIDELRDLALGGKKWVLEFEARERERTGIKSLKVGYNRVFGYYIEVTKANQSMVPDDYIRKQTLASAERYITPELREKEAAILGAEEKLRREEQRVFCEVRDFVARHMKRIQGTARALAQIDVLAALAEVAVANNYCKPEVTSDGPTFIKEGRHPVVEQVLPPGTFVPNDLKMDDDDRILVITGPNMGGKSTYCRQAALIVIMAQMGSYVPAKQAAVACVDKVFARVGAYDDLVLGQSTFMVEMAEVARILRSVTDKSLVMLDEIGRGTSTFDGLAVAWAVVEFLSGEPGSKTGPRALVATHYRELTLLADLRPCVRNYCVSVRRTGEEIVFLRKVAKGVAEGSFGIDVSAMAGLPPKVVERAREILAGLEAEARRGARWRTGILGQIASRTSSPLLLHGLPGQASLFDGVGQGSEAPEIPAEAAEVIQELESLDVDRMTPLEALQKLYELKRKIAEEGR